MMSDKPKLLNFMTLRGKSYFRDSTVKQLNELYEAFTVEPDLLDTRSLTDIVSEFQPDAILTGWGSSHAVIDDAFLNNAATVKVWGHMGSSLAANFKASKRPDGIIIINTASIIGRYVAETTVLNLGRMLRRYDLGFNDFRKNAQQGHYDDSDLEKSLFTAKIGLLGLGCVGREVVKLLAVFNSDIYVYDPFLDKEFAEKYGLKAASMEWIAENCDAVSIHMPSIQETKNAVDREFLNKMKDNAVLINTARGSIVDSEALAEEVNNGRLYAAVDVAGDENDPLKKIEPRPNYLYTPHIAGILPSARHLMLEELLKEINKVLSGRETVMEASDAALKMG